MTLFKLSTLAISLGFLLAIPSIYGLMRPGAYGAALRRFPRSLPWGYFLTLLATGWFIYNLRQESIADFESLKPILYILFAGVGIGSCLFLKDFLAVRGAAVMMLLLARSMVDSARWAETDWRLVIVVWAYVLVILGMWFTISPWRMRDLVLWKTSSEGRIRIFSGVRLLFALLVLGLGFTVFRAPVS